ncbi:MAG: hypothetical protein IJW49_00825 [Clostridia bacterium]|nr:hypothetical protein [Clostridia bacterium]
MAERRRYFTDWRNAWKRRGERFEAFLENRIFGNPRVQRLMPFIRPLLIYLFVFPLIAIGVPYFHKAFWKREGTGNLSYAVYLGTAVELLLVFAILHSFILTFAIYNRLERRPFLERNPSEFDKKTERKRILSDRSLWIELLMLLMLLLLHPVSWGLHAPFDLIPGGDGWHPLLKKGLLFAVFFPILFLFEWKARMSARRVWIEAPSLMMRRQIWKSMETKKRRRYGLLRMSLRILAHLAVYSIGIWVLPFMIENLLTIFFAIIGVLLHPVLWIIVGIWLLWIYLRAFFARARFLRRLKKSCRKNGFELFELRRAYRSIFFDFSSYTFGVRAHGKTFYCRLLSSVKRSNNIHVHADGTLRRLFTVSIPQLGLLRVYRRRALEENPNDRSLELFHLSSATDYTFEADGYKVLLLNPVARRVYSADPNGKLYPLDNGDRVGEYKIFAGNAFLRALERDCADK